MGGIFLSYRRDDSSGHTGRLTDDLREALPDRVVFRDIDTIAPGADFVQAIDSAVGQADVVLAVIGRRWLRADGASGGQSLADSDDYVRLEISSAFEQGKLVIPVLVDGAQIPAAADLPDSLKPLVRNNAIEISDQRWKYDLDRLVVELERVMGVPTKAPPIRAPRAPVAPPRRVLVGSGCLLLLVAGIAAVAIARPGLSGAGSAASAVTTTSTSAPPPTSTTSSVPERAPSPEPASPPRPAPQAPAPQAPAPQTPAPRSPAPAPTPAPTTPPPATRHSFPDSPDGRFRAIFNGINYQVVNLATSAVVLTTIDEYGEANEVQTADFSADSTIFAAGYHFSHEGLYTYVGYWSTSSGALVTSKRVPGFLYSLDGHV
ncbi:MAG TPA: toll/interleukin-1 receptor domain-containing protein [Acidimicrobiales bacterium]|nr:toll/interleukin-1 receptor domain-containing protein [Acidimicrobiales bacterium]